VSIKEAVSDHKTIAYTFPASTAIAIGDLLWNNSGAAAKASAQSDQGTEAANQELFASLFLGVSNDQRLATETDAGTRTIRTDVICDCTCPSTTWAIGDLVGPSEASNGTELENQQVEKVTLSERAIGYCIKAGTSLTTVRCRLISRYLPNVVGSTLDASLADDTPLVLGTGSDAYLLWSTGDASDHSVVLALGDTSQMLHVTDKAAAATDWGVVSPTHPTLYIHSNTTPTTDYISIGGHDATRASIAVASGTLDITAVGEVTVNDDSADVNFRVESNALANFLLVDAAECLNGTLSIGAAAPTNPQAMFALLPPANATGVTANQSYFHAQILPGGATVAPTGTAPVVASLNVHEPNLTATGTITDAATVRIVDAPTEGSGNWALWVDAGATRLDGTAYIGDTSNAGVTLGLTINQAANDDGILALKSSDVAHGVTDVAETDTYAHFLKAAAADGGLRVIGLSDVTTALDLYGISTTEDTTDAPTTSSATSLILRGAVKSGTGVAALGATGNLLAVMNTTVNEFVVKGDGELYSNQSATVGTFDEHDDAVLCADLSYALSQEYGKIVSYGEDVLTKLGILTRNEDGTPAMYSVTKMLMLSICAIGQLGRQINTLADRLGVKVAPNGGLLAGPPD
jgi:hypothetical protein